MALAICILCCISALKGQDFVLKKVLRQFCDCLIISNEKIRLILQAFFDKGENASQVVENVNSVYSAMDHAKLWFLLFRSGKFGCKDVPCSGRQIVENIIKIMKDVEPDRHVSTVSHCFALLPRGQTLHKKKFKKKEKQKEVRYMGATQGKKPHVYSRNKKMKSRSLYDNLNGKRSWFNHNR